MSTSTSANPTAQPTDADRNADSIRGYVFCIFFGGCFLIVGLCIGALLSFGIISDDLIHGGSMSTGAIMLLFGMIVLAVAGLATMFFGIISFSLVAMRRVKSQTK